MRRLLARLLDYTIVMLFVWIFPVSPGICMGATAVLSPLLAAFCIAHADATPGKWIFGISVENRDGTLLSFGRALKREVRAYIFGFGLGLSLLAVLAGFIARYRLLRDGETSWDRKLGVRVLYRRKVQYKALALLLVFMALVFVGMVFLEFTPKGSA